MNTFDLPLHPTMRHPLTGAPLRAITARPGGGYLWPMMGGAPDDGADDGDGAGGGGAGGAGGSGEGDGADGAGDQAPDGYAVDQQGKSLGYPKDTAVVEMKVEEQAAYYKHQSRKHEQRASEWKEAAGGKTPAEVRAEREELTRLRTAGMSEQERETEQAREAARNEARLEALTGVARLAFETALSHVSDEDRSTLIENLDLSKVITDSGIDTDKVKSIAASISSGRPSRTPDYGGGRRDSKSSSGVAAGAAMFAERKKPASSSSA